MAPNLGNQDQTESWLNRTWRPAAAVVYLAICLFDFIIAPSYMGFSATDTAKLVTGLRDIDTELAIAIIQNKTPWVPLTLQGSGLFHVAFGAILGVAAWTRGNAQIEQIKQSGESDRSPNTPVMMPTYYLPSQVQPQTPASPLQEEMTSEFPGIEDPDRPE